MRETETLRTEFLGLDKNIKYLQVSICNGGYGLINIFAFKIGLTALQFSVTSVAI